MCKYSSISVDGAEINFQDSRGPRGMVYIVSLAARSRFAKNAADAKLMKNFAKHWRFLRAAAGTIYTIPRGPLLP